MTSYTIVQYYCASQLMIIIIIIIIHEFPRDASLEQYFRASDVFDIDCRW